MSEFYFWTECNAHGHFDPYGFLRDEFFDLSSRNYNIGVQLREIPPHEIYQDSYKYVSSIRGCGKKTTETIVDIIEKYQRVNSKHFCECGEPYLHWYEFCPSCGKKR